MRIRNLLMILTLGACCSTGVAETIAYWRFGDQGLNDVSGNGHALVNSNVDIDSTGAAIFNGTNAWLETAETLDLSGYNKLTVECFVKFPAAGVAGEIFAFTPEGAPQFQLAAADGVLSAKVVPGTGGINVETADIPTDGDWHHVAMIIDGYAAGASRVRLYVDGVRATTHVERVNWTVPFTAGTFELGAGFNGQVSSVRITTGVVAPVDFLAERQKSGMSFIIR